MAKEFDTDRATVTKVLAGITSEREGRAALEAWVESRGKKASADRDPETGLSWWQARLREDVIKSRAAREREKQLSGGELLPLRVVEDATKQIGYCLEKFASSLYAYGVALDPAGRAVVDRLAREAKEDFNTYIRQCLDRAAEIETEKQASKTAHD